MKRIKYESPVLRMAVCCSRRVIMASLVGDSGENFTGDVSGSWSGDNSGESFSEQPGGAWD